MRMIKMNSKKSGPIIDWLIARGVTKDVIGANVLLIAVLIGSLYVALFVNKTAFISTHYPAYREDIPLNVQKTMPLGILKQFPSRNAQ